MDNPHRIKATYKVCECLCHEMVIRVCVMCSKMPCIKVTEKLENIPKVALSTS